MKASGSRTGCAWSIPRSASSRSAPARVPATRSHLFTPGASGRAYLLAGRLASGDELISAIHDVAAGATVVDPAVVDTLVATPGR